MHNPVASKMSINYHYHCNNIILELVHLYSHFSPGCMERLYVNGRLTNLGSGQQHKINPGCEGEETVHDQAKPEQRPRPNRRRNNQMNNEVQVLGIRHFGTG